MKRQILLALGALGLTAALALPASTQDTESTPETGSVSVPDTLFEPETKALNDLRIWSVEKWLGVRQTNHPLYHYPLGAARLRAYLHFCKRHQLNVDMHPIETLAIGNLVEIMSAHYEETEWAAFKDMDEDAIRGFLADMARDLYAYEFANAVTEQTTAKEASGKINKFYCEDIARENFQDYVALRATAKRELGL